MDIQVDTQGMAELAQRLKSLRYETRYKGGRFAGRKAANVIANAVKARARQLDDPSSPENIAANVTVRWNNRRFKRDGTLAFRIGIRGGAKAGAKEDVQKAKGGKTTKKANPGGDTWHWRLLEFGTKKMPARPFMRPAMQTNASAAIQVFITEYQKAIDRAIKRAARQGTTA